MVYIYTDDIRIVKDGNEVKIEIVDDETKKEIIKEYFSDFLNNSNIGDLENAMTIDKDYLKNYILQKVKEEISKAYINNEFFFKLLKNLDTIEKKLEVFLREEIKERIKGEEIKLNPNLLIKVFEELGYDEEKRKEIIRETLKFESYLTDYLEYCIEFRKFYPELVSEILNKDIDKLLGKLKNYWRGFYFTGRGWEWEEGRDFFLKISELKDLLNDESREKIQKFLLFYNIEDLIKRRIKNDGHRDYIKVIIDFLPDEMKRKYLVYFL
jgi:hypothetical protein